MRTVRDLDWQGCFNARDLGGLPTADGRTVRWGAVVRADGLDRLTPEAWEQVKAHGVRTIIDLRNDGERARDRSMRPHDVHTTEMPIDNITDRTFWDDWSSGWQFGTPLYYGPHLRQFPAWTCAVIVAIAQASPGGVLFHCSIGRDRTGFIAMLLLNLLGVGAEDIAEDYALSHARLPPLFELRNEPDQGPIIDAFLAERNTSTRQIIIDTLATFDSDAWMRRGGLDASTLTALRTRLVG